MMWLNNVLNKESKTYRHAIELSSEHWLLSLGSLAHGCTDLNIIFWYLIQQHPKQEGVSSLLCVAFSDGTKIFPRTPKGVSLSSLIRPEPDGPAVHLHTNHWQNVTRCHELPLPWSKCASSPGPDAPPSAVMNLVLFAKRWGMNRGHCQFLFPWYISNIEGFTFKLGALKSWEVPQEISPTICAFVSQDQRERFLHIQRTAFRFVWGHGDAEKIREGQRREAGAGGWESAGVSTLLPNTKKGTTLLWWDCCFCECQGPAPALLSCSCLGATLGCQCNPASGAEALKMAMRV